MSKFTCLVLCAVAVSLSSVNGAATKPTLRDLYRPVIVKCSQEHGVTDADIQAAAEAGSVASIPPCFLGCVYKTSGLVDAKGNYDLATGMTNLKQFVTDPAQFDEIAGVAKNCASVQDKPTSDGAAGCERGVQIASCFLEHKTNVLI